MFSFKRLFINISVLIITVVLIFLLFEIFFRIYLGSNLSYNYKNDLWILKPDQKGFTCPNNKIATINEFGFRGEYDSSKKSIIFLGDSFIFGYCLRDNEILTYNLKKVLKNNFSCDIELINAGVPGYGIKNMIDLYNKKFKNYSSKYIILNIIKEDILRQDEKDDSYFKRKMVIRKLIRSSSFLSFLKPRLEIFRQLITGSNDDHKKYFDKYLNLDKKRINDFNEQLKKENKTLILHIWRYKENQTEFYENMKSFSDEKNILIFDDYYSFVFNEYSGEKKELYVKEDNHPSENQIKRITAKIAEPFYKFIEKECQN